MEKAIVRKYSDQGKFFISFNYTFKSGKSKACSFEGALSAPLQSLLDKIKLKLKIKPSQSNLEEDTQIQDDKEQHHLDTSVVLFVDEQNVTDTDFCGQIVSAQISNGNALKEDCVLKVDTNRYVLHVNPPYVKSLKLSDIVMVGCVTSPRYDLEFCGESPRRTSNIDWFREITGPEKQKIIEETKTDFETKEDACNGLVPKSSHKKSLADHIEERVWYKIHSGWFYTPKAEDIGSKIKVTCTPSNGFESGEPKSTTTKTAVRAYPDGAPRWRQQLTAHRTDPKESGFRVVTYNILADVHAKTTFSKKVLYPYCPVEFLDMDYRRNIIIKELLGYNADILCLQEVDEVLFRDDCKPILEFSGYSGSHKCKTGKRSEGAAIFFNEDTFRCLGWHDLDIMRHLSTSESCSDIWKKICDHENLKTAMEIKKQVMQVVALKCCWGSQDVLIVGNTHLLCDPKTPHVRLLQMAACLKHLESVVELYTKQGYDTSLVICGDFNSNEKEGLHEFLSTGHFPSNRSDWKAAFIDEEGHPTRGLDLEHPFQLESAAGFPAFTNYVSLFNGPLDYIYTDKSKLKTTKVVPLPSEEEVTEQVGLPSEFFPSDHLAVVCELKRNVSQLPQPPGNGIMLHILWGVFFVVVYELLQKISSVIWT